MKPFSYFLSIFHVNAVKCFRKSTNRFFIFQRFSSFYLVYIESYATIPVIQYFCLS